MSPEWRLNPGFRSQKECPFLLSRGVPSIEVTNTKNNVNVFPGPDFVSPGWRCPLNRGVPKERFHCNGECVIANFLSQVIFMFI